MDDNQGWVRAVVTDIRDGPQGRFAATIADGFLGSITYTLSRNCWKGNRDPDPGEAVWLKGLTRKGGKWRASEAKF